MFRTEVPGASRRAVSKPAGGVRPSRLAALAGTVGMAAVAASLSLAGVAGAAGGIKGLSKSLQNGAHQTYEATYAVVGGGTSGTTTMVIAQAGGKSYFSTNSSTIITNGGKSYYCTGSGSSMTCTMAAGTTGAAGLGTLFNPSTIATELQAFQGQIAAHIPGVSIKTYSANYAGQGSTCVNAKARGKSGTWCAITKKGILSYESVGTQSITLKKFTSSPPASLFQVPAGATSTPST